MITYKNTSLQDNYKSASLLAIYKAHLES